jgi:hypothetical protein
MDSACFFLMKSRVTGTPIYRRPAFSWETRPFLEMLAIEKAEDWEERDARALRNTVRTLRAEGNNKQADTLEGLPIDRAAGRWFRSATTTEKTLDELVEQWLLGASYKEQTKATYRRAYGT